MKDTYSDNIPDFDENEEQEVPKSSQTETHIPIEYPDNIYQFKLDYCNETLYGIFNGDTVLKTGDFVIIPTRYGKDMARVLGKVKNPTGVQLEDIIEVYRLALKEDIERSKELEKKQHETLRTFKEKINAHQLDMKAINVHYLLEEQKVIFFFSSESRVDFRELVKDLVGVFKMRIELRQIGVRDEARVTGGLGVCGREFCCNSISDKLKSVSIKMAKEQNLSLNSLKISGQCGRLLCCLSYEHDGYLNARKNMPPEGIKLRYQDAMFRIVETNPILETIKITDDKERYIELKRDRFTQINGRWKIID